MMQNCVHEWANSRLMATFKSEADETWGDPPTSLIYLDFCTKCGILCVPDKAMTVVRREQP